MPTPDPHEQPNRDPKAHGGDPSVREGFEVTDANVGGIAVFLIALFISVVVFFVFCFGMGKVINNGLDRADGPINKWRAENQIAPRKAIQSSPQLEQQQLASLTRQFPTPRLETDDGNQDLADLHDRENLLLENYSWIDRGKGTVRIPIERAMQIIAQKGLPVAPQEQEQAAMVGDSRPTVQMPLTDGYAPTAYEQELHGETMQPGEQASSKANNK
ncbi:MAG TPA: hypothetical protein VGS02_03450 [Acidobacteriaceae bacterium]|nr:hypothetical protein [Acidobacteriaceae bacterium]